MPFSSPEHARELTAMFALCDRNDDGRIDLAEFGELMGMLGDSDREAAATASFLKIDHDGDGYITLAEFMEWREQDD
jgi:Ca2+-binding EF-hand superfamily protein